MAMSEEAFVKLLRARNRDVRRRSKYSVALAFGRSRRLTRAPRSVGELLPNAFSQGREDVGDASEPFEVVNVVGERGDVGEQASAERFVFEGGFESDEVQGVEFAHAPFVFGGSTEALSCIGSEVDGAFVWGRLHVWQIGQMVVARWLKTTAG